MRHPATVACTARAPRAATSPRPRASTLMPRLEGPAGAYSAQVLSWKKKRYEGALVDDFFSSWKRAIGPLRGYGAAHPGPNSRRVAQVALPADSKLGLGGWGGVFV